MWVGITPLDDAGQTLAPQLYQKGRTPTITVLQSYHTAINQIPKSVLKIQRQNVGVSEIRVRDRYARTLFHLLSAN